MSPFQTCIPQENYDKQDGISFHSFSSKNIQMSNCRHEKYKGTDWSLLGVILFKSYNKIAKSPDYFTTLPRSALCDSFTNDSSKFSSLAPTKRWSMPVLDTNKTPDYQVTNRNHCPLIISGDRTELTSYGRFFLVKFIISSLLRFYWGWKDIF